MEAEILQEFLQYAEWQKRLSPAETLLISSYPAAPHPWNQATAIPVTAGRSATFHLPLTPDQRRTVLDWPLLPARIREMLLEDDARDPRPRTPRQPTPVVAPQPESATIIHRTRNGKTEIQMDSALLRRYGLLPKTDAPPTVPPTSSAPAAEAATPGNP